MASANCPRIWKLAAGVLAGKVRSKSQQDGDKHRAIASMS